MIRSGVDPEPSGHALSRSIEQFDTWMREAVLPAWASAGLDKQAIFAERLAFDGSASEPGFRRFRVLARQSAVFSKASRSVDSRYESIAQDAWDALVRRTWIPEWGWAARIDPSGSIIDKTMELYDQAFGLYALSSRLGANSDTALLDLALECLRLIDLHFRDRNERGWYSLKSSLKHDQNPHMHFLEALLSLHENHQLHQFSDRIYEIIDILDNLMYSSAHCAVFEHFMPDWRAARPYVIEPGHQFEWYWLLRKAEYQGFEVPGRLFEIFDTGRRIGYSSKTGLYVNRCNRKGLPFETHFRIWPQCEAIKAYAIHPNISLPIHRQELAHIISAMKYTFLDQASKGLWIDQIDATRKSLVDHVPASTLYHLFEAWLSVKDLK